MVTKEDIIKRIILSLATGEMVDGVLARVSEVKEPTKAQLRKKNLEELDEFRNYNNYEKDKIGLKPDIIRGKLYYDIYSYDGPKGSMEQIMDSYKEYRS